MYKFDRNEYNARMDWYKQARFGMFIHWGLYSIPARGEWIRSTERISKEDYYKYFEEFYAKDFDPKKWAKLAKEAGMKYVVLTAKHHDGFCLYDTKYTDFNSMNCPAKRDFVREYVEAIRAEGLKVGLYFSLIDWAHEDFPHYNDRIHPMRGNDNYTDEGRDFERYKKFLYNQVEEICSNYGKLDLLWFDFSYDDMRGEKWGATKLIDMVRSYQPTVIIDNRLEVSGEGRGSLANCNPSPYHGDFVTPEQMVPPEGILDVEGNPMVWESCITLNNNWGYCKNDKYWKSSDMVVKKLVECVSKGGNMILNVGPDAHGNIPEESVNILKRVGKWMEKNSESIYSCGKADIPKPEYGRATQNGDCYYFHVYEDSIGPLPLIGINKQNIEYIRELSSGCEIPISNSWVHSDYPDIVFANLGPNPNLPDSTDYVLKVKMKKITP